MSISFINNGERGSSVRDKLNLTITEANKVADKLNKIEDDLIPKLGANLDSNQKRILFSQGEVIISSNDLILGGDGNVFNISGTQTINLISNLEWKDGSVIGLRILEIGLQIKHLFIESENNRSVFLKKRGDYTTIKEDEILVLILISGIWYEINSLTETGGTGGAVSSVNTKTGDVVLNQDDILNGVIFTQTHNDFTDQYIQYILQNNDKIGLTQSILDSISANNTHRNTVLGNPHQVTKEEISLGNVDNTSDVDKPISTAQQVGLNLKVNISDIIDNLLSSDTNKPLSANQGKILKDLINNLSATLIPQGSWDADTNIPDISGTTETGFYWIVSVAGDTNIGGITDWNVNDWVIKTETGWVKIDNTDKVLSVNSKIGDVILTQDDVLNGSTFVQTHNDLTNEKSVAILNNKNKINYTTSPMLVSGGEITAGTNPDTLKVNILKGYLRETNSKDANLVEVNLQVTDNIEIPTLNTMYIITLDYNSGTPQIVFLDGILNENTEIPIGYAMKDSAGVFYREGGFRLQEAAKRLHDKDTIVNSVKLQSGCKVSDGDRYVKITTGIAYSGVNKYILNEVDTSVADTFGFVYNDGDWVYTAGETQVNNTQYNDFGTGLATLANNQYGIYWIWRNPTTQHTALMMGTASYTLAEAQAVNEIISIPEKIGKFGALIGKIIIKKGADDFIFQPLDNTLAFTGAYDHNDLLNKGTITHEEIDAKFKKGSDIASASTITIPLDGEFCEVTGTTTIDLIETSGYVAGKTIALKFTGICTLNFETATSGTAVGMHLVKGSNYTTVAGDIIVLKFDGTIWQEVNNLTNSFWKGDGEDISYDKGNINVTGEVKSSEPGGVHISFTAYNPTSSYPRGVFLIGSGDGDSITNVGFSIAPDISLTAEKNTFLEIKTTKNYTATGKRFFLFQNTNSALIIAASGDGSSVGTSLGFTTQGMNGTPALFIDTTSYQKIGIEQPTPTARLHLPAGTATAGTAPLKIPDGVLLTVLEDGAIERQNNKLYITFDD